jgi:hypothetical protein
MPDGAELLAHLERAFGEYDGNGVAAPEWKLPFSVLRFDDVSASGVTSLVTFGLSGHVLAGGDGNEHVQELVVSLRQDDVALDLVASVGAYVLDRHVALVVGETVGIPPELRTALDRLVVAPPVHVDGSLAELPGENGNVELVWLLPFAPGESHVAVEHGWQALYDWLRAEGADPFDLAREPLA